MMQSLKMRWVVWVWKHTPNCAEMSRLSSRSLEQPLNWKTRLKMGLHFVICTWCKRYQKHLRFLHRHAPQLEARLELHALRGLSTEAKTRIKIRLFNEATPNSGRTV